MPKKILHLLNSKIVLYLAYLIPIVLLIGFMARYGVNVPFADEWGLVDTFHKVYTGEATLQYLAGQHNEHRILFPRIIFLALAFPSKWEIAYERYFNVFLSIITFLAICRIAHNQHHSENKRSLHLANLLSCILIFSVVQHETWLSGFQLTWVIITSCLAVAALLLDAPKSGPIRFLGAALLCFVASFSSAHGLFPWLALLPSVVLIPNTFRQRFIKAILWFSLFAGCFALYMHGYHKPPGHPDPLYFLDHPWSAANYLLTLLGSSLIRSRTGAVIAGLILLFLFAIFALYYARNSKLRKLSAPWLSLGAFSILFALATTLGRAGFGAGQAMSTRYITASIFLTVSVIQMWRLLLDRSKTTGIASILGKWQFQGFSGILIGICIVNSFQAVSVWHGDWNHRSNGKACLEMIYLMDESHFIGDAPNSCLKHLFPATPPMKGWTDKLIDMGFRDFPQNVPFISNPEKSYGAIELSTDKESAIFTRDDTVSISGWAILPDNPKPPKIVILTEGDSQRFFASAYVEGESPDIAEKLGSNRYGRAGWSVAFSPEQMQPGEKKLKAWVYDPDGEQFIQLSGEPKIEVVEQ